MANDNLPACTKCFKGELYRQMHDDLHLAGMAQRTIHGGLRSVRKLADFCQRPPDQISETQLRQWLTPASQVTEPNPSSRCRQRIQRPA